VTSHTETEPISVGNSLLSIAGRSQNNKLNSCNQTDIFRRIHKMWKATFSLLISSCLPFCLSEWNNSAPTSRIFMKFQNFITFRKSVGKFCGSWNLIKITCTLHNYLRIFTVLFRWILLRMVNISDEYCRENQNAFYFQKPFRKSCRSWDNFEKYGGTREATYNNCMVDH
jgi:hypothetical protein